MPILVWKAPEHFYAYLDEKAFFTWLESISGVTKVLGDSEGLKIHLRSPVSKNCLYDLIAIYSRYEGNMSELAQLLTENNKSWFKNKNMYWYESVFVKSKSDKKKKARQTKN